MVTFTKGLQAKMKGNMYCHQICQQIYWLSVNLLADLLNLNQEICQTEIVGGPVFLLADLWTLTNFTGQIYWLSPNLPADLLTLSEICQQKCRGCFCHQIYWLSPNLLVRFCWLWPNLLVEILGGTFLPADMVQTVTKSARQIYWLSHQMCWQK